MVEKAAQLKPSLRKHQYFNLKTILAIPQLERLF